MSAHLATLVVDPGHVPSGHRTDPDDTLPPCPRARSRVDDPDDHLHPRPPAARRVGVYEIGQEVGRGATSRVFVARRIGSPFSVAFKELRSQPGDPRAGQQFLTEARILGSIDHPHVVAMHDVINGEPSRALVLDLVTGGSLRRYIRTGLGLAQVGCVLEDVLSALAQLERQRIVHLDIKPDNLLVTSSGGIKIADFGVARVLGPGTGAATALVGGTPHYLAPEHSVGAPVGAWTDLYAVGILAFELLVGSPPFADTRDPVEVVARHVHCNVPRVCDLLPGMSTLMADWIDRLVAKSPSDRPTSALEAWADLEKLLTECLGTSWRLAGGL